MFRDTFRDARLRSVTCASILYSAFSSRHPNHSSNHLTRADTSEKFHIKRRVEFGVVGNILHYSDKRQPVFRRNMFVRDYTGQCGETRKLLDMPMSGNERTIDDAFEKHHAGVLL
ncbi:hypothetical protein PBS_26390 [Paraburkholderia sp. 2C]|jgi:hypothetical protein